jgi:hypothetical protein
MFIKFSPDVLINLMLFAVVVESLDIQTGARVTMMLLRIHTHLRRYRGAMESPADSGSQVRKIAM